MMEKGSTKKHEEDELGENCGCNIFTPTQSVTGHLHWEQDFEFCSFPFHNVELELAWMSYFYKHSFVGE